MTAKPGRWKWIHHEGTTLRDIAVNPDGTLHNPNGYPPETVRAAISGAEQRRHERRSEAARQAAETRRARQDKRVYEAARRIVDGEVFGPAGHCFICKRSLDDPQSIQRGIGSECWQDVLKALAARRQEATT